MTIVALGERCVISWSSYGLKQEIPWKFYYRFLYILLLLCIYNVSHKSYHVMVSDQLSSKQKGGMVSIAWEMAFLSLLQNMKMFMFPDINSIGNHSTISMLTFELVSCITTKTMLVCFIDCCALVDAMSFFSLYCLFHVPKQVLCYLFSVEYI